MDAVRLIGHEKSHASAIVALGQASGLRIVAEGVETNVQQNFLTQLGCDSLQGYLLGHPLPAGRFMARYQSRGAIGGGLNRVVLDLSPCKNNH